MRLLSVNMSLDPASGGGSAVRTLQSTRALADLGVECAVATSREGIDDRLRAQLQGVGLTTMPVILGRFRLPCGSFSALRAAVRWADVVLLVNHWTAINVLTWRYVRKFDKPYAVCPAGALPIGGGRSQSLKRGYNALWGRAIVAGADAHIAVTAAETAQFAAYGVDPATVTVVPNGLPEAPPGNGAAFRTRHGLADAPLLLYLGRLAPIKGPDLLIGALALCAAERPDWHLVLAGPDDGMQAELRRQVDANGLTGRVHFVGFLDESAKADALAAADLLVVPSRREAMSIVVLEAANARRPVLITDQCGVPEVAESGGGWVVEADEKALARGLLQATRDRDDLPRRGQVWSEAARARYGWPEVARRYIDVFASAIARHRG